MQQNTALIDDIMAALDAESSQNVELIVRNTQNGATKKMALASLEQIIYSYLTTAPVVTNLASVLGAVKDYGLNTITDFNDAPNGFISISQRSLPNSPSSEVGVLLTLRSTYVAQIFFPLSSSYVYIRQRDATDNSWYSWNRFTGSQQT